MLADEEVRQTRHGPLFPSNAPPQIRRTVGGVQI